MNAGAIRQAHSWLVEDTDLYSNVIDAAGEYDAKVDFSANSSLAAHILNAVTVGVNTFVFNAVGPGETAEDYEEDIRALASALTLHDTNKYVREAYGFDAEGNTSEAFEYYFEPEIEDEEGDDFGIEEFLGEGYRTDLLYLVQNTEIREDSRETRGTSTKFRGLERYCRIGDQIASIALREGVQGVYRKLSDKLNDDDVHLIRFTEIEQPLLNDVLLSTAKQVIAGETGEEPYGVVIGSSPNAIVYLGNKINRSRLRTAVSEYVPKRIGTFEFSCKLGWNSFDYDILAEINIPLEQKKDEIREQAEELLLSGSGGIEPFESIPDGFREYLPILVKAIYEDNQNEYPTTSLTEAYNETYDSIEGGKSTKSQKIKIFFLSYLCRNWKDHKQGLDLLREELEEELESDLEPQTDAVGAVVERFFGGQQIPELGSKEEMCFLCGAETDTKYQKGLSAIYRTQEYSRRVPPHAKYKSICEVCNLEYALLADICERSDVSTNNSIEVAYFYFDDFLGDIRVRSRRIGNIVQGDGNELDDRELRASLVEPQYFLQPVYVLDENHRMVVIRQIMEAAQESGMKVVVGRPFTRFESADAVFSDEEATRPQELLGLDEADRFGPLPDFVGDDRTHSHLRRTLQLFRIMSMIGQEAGMNNPYIQLDRDTFHSIADFAVVHHDNATRLSILREYFETYHEQALMDMKTVAERGIDLFGKQYDSKYKKTKVFREAIDAFLSGKSQRMDDERLIEYVESQVYAAADREDYAGYVETEQAEAFVEAIQTYLIDNDLYDLKKLSDWEDALVNSYYYAYDQTLSEQ